MSRSLWITLLVALAALWLVTHHHRQPINAVATAGGAVRCALPERFSDPNQPLQSNDDGRMPPFRLDNATVTPLAGFSLQARVLSREDYWMGDETKYSPTDLALGWGPMANPAVSDKLGISQGGRWYYYQWGSEGPPIAPDEIVRSSANMHMIPADDTARRELERVRAGEVIHLQGFLVDASRANGWRWRTSMSRDDTGDGACELVYVESVEAAVP